MFLVFHCYLLKKLHAPEELDRKIITMSQSVTHYLSLGDASKTTIGVDTTYSGTEMVLAGLAGAFVGFFAGAALGSAAGLFTADRVGKRKALPAGRRPVTGRVLSSTTMVSSRGGGEPTRRMTQAHKTLVSGA